ncbi:hypothetical protein P3T76_012199 [Phytophthora citrophthora]|uniref:Uncharacterized protein n=1 Tax=Phytophthora citrophthora TaxID=4793 RepID=A0AAD9G5H5_9STRA|nr:hypothetical protein P3T76_012199 [Phytophthora citrophthora]
MPITFVSAMESSNSEINSLRKNETWVLVPLPKGTGTTGHVAITGHVTRLWVQDGQRRGAL